MPASTRLALRCALLRNLAPCRKFDALKPLDARTTVNLPLCYRLALVADKEQHLPTLSSAIMITKALVMLASATLAASAAPQQYESYDYAEPVKQFCLVIPKGLQTVRGILVVCNYMGGDSRGYYTQDWYSEFMNLHDFAFLGSKGDPSHAVSYQGFCVP